LERLARERKTDPIARRHIKQSGKLKPNEIVWFHCDQENEKAMKDPRIAKMSPPSMPLDGKRMFWGGFNGVVSF
jgi:uncharacterized protein YbaA (DUF1428 family)